MKKILLTVLLLIASLQAATVAGDSEGKRYDTAFLDVSMDGNVLYHYVKYYGQGFDLKSRKLRAVFDDYKRLKQNYAKLVITGRMEIPRESEKEIILKIVGKPTNAHMRMGSNTRNGYQNAVAYLTDTRWSAYGWQLFLQGKAISSDRNRLKVSEDALGNKFLEFRIEGLAYRGNFQSHLNNMLNGMSALSFMAEYTSKQQKRGDGIKTTTTPLRVYVLEE